MSKKEEARKSLVDRLNSRKVSVKFDARSYLQLYENGNLHLEAHRVEVTDLFLYWLDSKHTTIVPCVEGWDKDHSNKEMAYFDASKNKWHEYEIPGLPRIEEKVIASSSLKGKKKSNKKKK